MTTEISKSARVIRKVGAQKTIEGGGFTVRRPFPTAALRMVDPYLMIDEMGPVDYAPGEAIGAPDHPHRGFQTITYLIEGNMEHKDSFGGRFKISDGGVQWMTAGSGIVHSEMPDEEFKARGGRVHGFQVWVNLPAKLKMIPPNYQGLNGAEIPEATSPDGKVKVRVVAGESLGISTPMRTNQPLLFLHVTLQPGAEFTQPVPANFNLLAYVFQGATRLGIDNTVVKDGELAVFESGSESVTLRVAEDASQPAQLLLMGGVALNEPVAQYGPFVMNTEEEIYQAIRDYQDGKMGSIKF